MTAFWCSDLYSHKVRIFDYSIAQPFRDELRENAERKAKENEIEIEHIRKRNVRKEDRVKAVLAKRGRHPGLVAIVSAMEPCASYQPWHNKQTGKTYLTPDDGKCLHYYFYFIDQELGLTYVRVPTWLPCHLQIYFNEHNWLAVQLEKRNIPYELRDNAFVEISDWRQAQRLLTTGGPSGFSTSWTSSPGRFCPIFRHFGLQYHWSIDQSEYATDIVFRRQADLAAIYENLTRTAIHSVKPDNIATFLGKKLHGNYQDEVGNRFNIRIEGTRIQHTMGPVSIKRYDKFSLILRIETTVNDVSFFKHYREVEHRHGSKETKYAALQKTSIACRPCGSPAGGQPSLSGVPLSAMEDNTAGTAKLNKISRKAEDAGRSYPGPSLIDQAYYTASKLTGITIRTRNTPSGIAKQASPACVFR